MQPTITSRPIQILLGALALLVLLSLAFLFGTKAGERRSRHFCNWSAYYPDMMNSRRGLRGGPSAPPFRTMPFAHGVFGRVLSATGTHLIIEGRDQFEQSVVVSTSTAIRSPQGTVSSTDIQPNMEVGVFGTPNAEGQIEARLIRLSPPRAIR